MRHLAPFVPRSVMTLPVVTGGGWQVKQHAILAAGRSFEPSVTHAAFAAASKHLPQAGTLTAADGTHGVGFQIVHFAEVAVVASTYFWQWGSVLGRIMQMRAPWDTPTVFGPGAEEVVGCIWEMQIVAFEVEAWRTTVLGTGGATEKAVSAYMSTALPLS